jgi:hypothetical protein
VRLPSVKALIAHGLADTRKKAEEIRDALWNGEHKAVNRLLETWGVESICVPEGCFDRCETPRHEIEYFNPGDPYTATVMRIDRGSWFIGCWGDSLSWLERS